MVRVELLLDRPQHAQVRLGHEDRHVLLALVSDSVLAADSPAEVSRAANESFETELKAVFAELAEFKQEDASPRPSTLERRLEDYEDLRNRVDLYSEILGKQKDKLSRRLKEAEKVVRDLLTSTD